MAIITLNSQEFKDRNYCIKNWSLHLDTNQYIHSDANFVPVSLYELVGKSILVIPSLAEERFAGQLERLDRDVLTDPRFKGILGTVSWRQEVSYISSVPDNDWYW